MGGRTTGHDSVKHKIRLSNCRQTAAGCAKLGLEEVSRAIDTFRATGERSQEHTS